VIEGGTDEIGIKRKSTQINADELQIFVVG
jgi:hypothetical protein